MRQILDDRGDFVSASWFTTDGPMRESIALRARAAELKRELSRTAYRRTLQTIVIIAALLVAGPVVFVTMKSQQPGAPVLLMITTGALAAVVWSALRIKPRLQAELNRFRQAGGGSLEKPVCLQCRYQLKGLNPEPDGCTICPECGAAWRLNQSSPWSVLRPDSDFESQISNLKSSNLNLPTRDTLPPEAT